MIAENFDYSAPNTVEEALQLIAKGGKVLAGGMSLVPLMKLRLAAPEHLVDLGRVAALNGITEDKGSIVIGSMTTHHQLESSALLRASCPLLAETASLIGDVQVRNMGTIGGSVAHADPAADYPAALLALEAKVRLVKSSGDRTLAFSDFLIDSFTTALEEGELVREVVVPVETAGTGVSYQKMLQPASGFAIVGVAARIRKTAGKISFARIGVTGLSSCAFRAAAVEKLLEGTSGSEEEIGKAAAVVADGVDANSDIHASSNYRSQMARVYTARAIQAAVSRAA
ncbi:MAG: xanthine dehydrogenase family protein subunit M [Acidimicrobiia bacterium]|nr:xanthine dehydrogenase family protein subunit M [Acidimicrobiia bacterium]